MLPLLATRALYDGCVVEWQGTTSTGKSPSQSTFTTDAPLGDDPKSATSKEEEGDREGSKVRFGAKPSVGVFEYEMVRAPWDLGWC